MHRIHTAHVAFSILCIALLLLNPASLCAGATPGHPCCPKAPTNSDGGPVSLRCVCIDRQPTAPSVPAPAGSETIAADAVDEVVLPDIDCHEVAAAGSALIPRIERYLALHQLLV